jgi:hypothetical protein
MERKLEGPWNVGIGRIPNTIHCTRRSENRIQQVWADLSVGDIGSMQHLPAAANQGSIGTLADSAGDQRRMSELFTANEC